MEEWFFYSSAAAAACSFLMLIALSLAGGALERRMKGGEAAGKAGSIVKTIVFALFLVLGFSFVPVAVGLFFPALRDVVPIDIGFLAENDMLFVFGAWAVYIIGLAIAFPELKRDFLGVPETAGGGKGGAGSAEAGAGASDIGAAAGPGTPSLDDAIMRAGAIVLADTRMRGDSAGYRVAEVWKRPEGGFPLRKGMDAPFADGPFRGRGYVPVERQQVVFFIRDRPPYDEAEGLLPVVGDYVMYAPSDAGAQEFLPLSDLKKRVLGAGPKGAAGRGFK